ncbi:MAG: S8 family serine peptidase [Actinomycetota bacterium]|nr:S8 family serine peptidase [Actinomycetota bacterium]
MRQDRNIRRGVRGNALWGRRGESRSNALWGSGKRGWVTLALAAMLVVPVAGSAANGGGGNGNNGNNGNGKDQGSQKAFVPNSLLVAAAAGPLTNFDVIIQGREDRSSNDTQGDVQNENGKVKQKFSNALSGSIEATVTGKQLLKLANNSHVEAITRNVIVHSAVYQDATMWPDSTDLSILQNSFNPLTGVITGSAPQAPAIAIVDSGVEPRSDFGGRLVASVTICSTCTDTAADAEGHGTMVAGVAAGSGLYPGGAQNAPIVSIRTANANGESRTSDVVAAADWILAHAAQYNIRVANFSLAGASDTTIRIDPLDKAVEALWLEGIVVVAAAGNHGNGGPVNMSYAPGNDPFVITVGALDQSMTSDPTDDTVAPWSAYGKTMDGFAKPDLSAPGRYMIAPVPVDSTLAKMAPDRIMAPGYMWMSGTSFSTPIVSAAAAQILARHPEWTPDQVKGALMLAANYLPNDSAYAAGVGEIAAGVASTTVDPPNPNIGLYKFVSTDPVTGAPTFNAASWAAYLKTGASWAQASWAEASWAAASWSAASWAAASWSEASWSSNIDSMMASMASMSE